MMMGIRGVMTEIEGFMWTNEKRLIDRNER